MELRVLRYFLAIVREENILRAAEALHVTQPALSRQIAQLEEEVGAKLFIRGSRRITLTDAGALLYRRAEEIVALADKTVGEIADMGTGSVSGTVSIGCGELNAVKALAKLIRIFSEQNPDVHFVFRSATADATKDWIDKGILDFGLLLEPSDYENFAHFRMNIPEPWVAVMRADSPLAAKEYVTADDLAGQKLIFPARKAVLDELERWLDDAYDAKNVISSNDLMNNAAALVEEGLGIAIGVEYPPSLYDPARFRLKKLHPEIVSDSVLVWKKNQPFGLAAARFRDFIVMSFEHNVL